MPEWLTTLQGDAPLILVIAWIAIAVLVLGVLVRLWPLIANSVAVINALVSLPAFIKRTDETLKGQNIKIDSIHHEVNYNNGTSVKDQGLRNEQALERVETRLGEVHDKLEDLTDADTQLRADFEQTHPHNPYTPKEIEDVRKDR